MRQWIFRPGCCIKGTQNASILKITEPRVSHCFHGLPKEHWPDYMTNVNTAIGLLQEKSLINSHHSRKRRKLKERKKFVCSIKKRSLQSKENRSSGSQQQLGGVTYESYVSLENISVNNTKNIPLPTSLPEERHHKDIESCTVWFLTLRLLVYQMIVTLFRFWVLIIFWAGLRGHPFSTYAKFFEKKNIS